MNLQNLLVKGLMNKVPSKYKAQAQEAMKLVENHSPEQVIEKLKSEGMDNSFIDSMYSKFADSGTAKDVCSVLGFSPEELKKQAQAVFSGTKKNKSSSSSSPKQKFPRLT